MCLLSSESCNYFDWSCTISILRLLQYHCLVHITPYVSVPEPRLTKEKITAGVIVDTAWVSDSRTLTISFDVIMYILGFRIMVDQMHQWLLMSLHKLWIFHPCDYKVMGCVLESPSFSFKFTIPAVVIYGTHDVSVYAAAGVMSCVTTITPLQA